MYQLVSKDDMGRKLVFPLIKVKTTIGRDPSCDIVLEDPEVSRNHLKIYIIDDAVHIKDMGSRNGTFLNNQRIEKMTDMGVMDEIIIGPNQFTLEQCSMENEEEVELTCMLTVNQLREFSNNLIPDSPEDDLGEAPAGTLVSNRGELLAGIYKKKLGVAKLPSIEIIFGPDSGRKHVLPPGEYQIGRVDSCNIRLVDDMISTLHGTFIVDKEGVTYKDEESLNGSVLNNRMIKTSKLKHRDTLMLGRTKIRFIDPRFSTGRNTGQGNSAVMGQSSALAETFRDVFDFMSYYWYFFLGAGIILLFFIMVLILN